MAFIRDDRGARHDNHGSHVVNRKDLEAIAELEAIRDERRAGNRWA